MMREPPNKIINLYKNSSILEVCEFILRFKLAIIKGGMTRDCKESESPPTNPRKVPK